MPESRDSRFHWRRRSSGPGGLPPSRGVSRDYYPNASRRAQPQDENNQQRPSQLEIAIRPQTPSPRPHRRDSSPDSSQLHVAGPVVHQYCPSQCSETPGSNVQVPSPPRINERRRHCDRDLQIEPGVSRSTQRSQQQMDGREFFSARRLHLQPPPVPINERANSVPPEVNPYPRREPLDFCSGNELLSPSVLPIRRSNSDRGNNSVMENTKGTVVRYIRRSSSNISLSSALGDKTYQYKPLEDLSIRLIEIFPERTTMIKCQIKHHFLEAVPPYLAISYAWGDPGDTCKIDIEGCLIPIPVSLHGALQAVRRSTDSVLVWADALSIDQQNLNERAQQIQLMPNIYSNAQSVAIWLGPDEDNSSRAVDFLGQLVQNAEDPGRVSTLLEMGAGNGNLAGVVSLFERDYWRRLWVVQEVLKAKNIMVYCGLIHPLKWDSYRLAPDLFKRHRHEITSRNDLSSRRRCFISPDQFSDAQVLTHQGPASILTVEANMRNGGDAFLEVLRACRRKLATDPKDKVFGILGILSKEVRDVIRVDYGHSIKYIYTEVVDFLLKTTKRMDVICEAIHFPVYISSTNLPSFVPDWSHIPQVTSSLGYQYNFSASGSKEAKCKFVDQRMNKLRIAAIPIDVVKIKGMAVGTLCNLGDYLMAFLHWRAILRHELNNENGEYIHRIEKEFAETLCLGQSTIDPSHWLTFCYTLFANLLNERLPCVELDKGLRNYLAYEVVANYEKQRELLVHHFGEKMMGRCFCVTERSLLGMGSGYMKIGDEIVVPLGCSTPILLRAEGPHGEFRFVGDVYINGYMNGEAVKDHDNNKASLRDFVLH